MFNTVWNLKSFASISNGAVIALFTATPSRLNEKNVTFRALGHLVNSEKKGYGRIIIVIDYNPIRNFLLSYNLWFSLRNSGAQVLSSDGSLSSMCRSCEQLVVCLCMRYWLLRFNNS